MRARLYSRRCRSVILRGSRSEVGAEAKALIEARNRPVRISLAGSDTVAQAGDEDVAHRDLGENALTALRLDTSTVATVVRP